MMAANSSGMSVIHYNSDDNDNDDLFLPSSGPSCTPGLDHCQPLHLNCAASNYNYYLSINQNGTNSDANYLESYMDGMQANSPLSRQESMSPPDTPDCLISGRRLRQGSIVDGLLHEIYDRWHFGRQDSFDSDTLTECSSTTSEFLWSGRTEFIGNTEGGYHSSVRRQTGLLSTTFLQTQRLNQLERLLADIQRSVAVVSARLVRQLKRRDRRIAKMGKNYDVITAILQAASLKRQIDTRMRFSIQPAPGMSAFDQWKDAMKAVARLPMGIPTEFRKKVWLSLADHYLVQLRINWDKTLRFVFNERSNPDDDKLGVQIVKDLHRTGCSNFSGDDNEEDRAILKRVLLAYARWNKRVGYCQGFNVIAALLLNVMDRKEDDALKVMIFLIDNVLPESYFANNLRALSVDMAVFRDLLGLTYPRLSKHLDRLQLAAQDIRTGACYEPPLTNVFTMQWFLTLFATCLPVSIVLRVWDSVLLEGSEVLLRTGLTIWARLSKRIMGVSSADEFYCLMGELSSSIMQGALLDGDAMVKAIYSLGDFPLPHINELREKYTYNIRPFTPAGTSSKKGSSSRSAVKSMLGSDDDELDDDDITAMACMPGDHSSDISILGPGVYGPDSDPTIVKGPMQMERMSTDINNLKLQYQRLKQRQQQAHIIIAAASAKKSTSSSSGSSKNVRQRQRIANMSATVLLPSIESPTAMNHLFVGKAGKLPSSGKNRLVTEGPRISELPSARKSGLLAKQLQAVAKAQAVSKSPRMRSGSSRTATASSSSCQGQAAAALTTSHTSSTSTSCLNSEIDQSKLALAVASVRNGNGKDIQCKEEVSLSEGENEEQNGLVISDSDSIQQHVESDAREESVDNKPNLCSEDHQLPKQGTGGDHSHINLTQSKEIFAFADDLQSKSKEEIPEYIYLESKKTAEHNNISKCNEEIDVLLLPSHNIPCKITVSDDNDNDSVIELMSEPSIEENIENVIDWANVRVDDSQNNSTSVAIMTKLEENQCLTACVQVPDSLQEDSGIETSSTTSPSITPGKRMCRHEQEGPVNDNQISHDNDDDEELILSVETTFISDDMRKTINMSQSQSENKNIIVSGVHLSDGEKSDLVSGIHLSEVESRSQHLSDDERLEIDKSNSNNGLPLPVSRSVDGTEKAIVPADCHQIYANSRQDDGNENENRSPSIDSSNECSSSDINTLLAMVATTSPQRKFIRSFSVTGSSYAPSPSLIETVSVPETLDVVDETVPVPQTLDIVVVEESDDSGNVLNKMKFSDGDNAISRRKAVSESDNNLEKSKTLPTPLITSPSGKEKIKDGQCLGNGKTTTCLTDTMDQSHRRASSPAYSLSLNSASTGHELTSTSKLSPSKPFNPFPIKLFNANRAKTGLKLGLYTPSTLQQLKGLKGRTPSS